MNHERKSFVEVAKKVRRMLFRRNSIPPHYSPEWQEWFPSVEAIASPKFTKWMGQLPPEDKILLEDDLFNLAYGTPRDKAIPKDSPLPQDIPLLEALRMRTEEIDREEREKLRKQLKRKPGENG